MFSKYWLVLCVFKLLYTFHVVYCLYSLNLNITSSFPKFPIVRPKSAEEKLLWPAGQEQKNRSASQCNHYNKVSPELL